MRKKGTRSLFTVGPKVTFPGRSREDRRFWRTALPHGFEGLHLAERGLPFSPEDHVLVATPVTICGFTQNIRLAVFIHVGSVLVLHPGQPSENLPLTESSLLGCALTCVCTGLHTFPHQHVSLCALKLAFIFLFFLRTGILSSPPNLGRPSLVSASNMP